jgi:hypothetical protein
MWGCRAVFDNSNGDGDDRPRHDIAELWPCPAIDCTGGQVKQKIDDARGIALEQARKEFLKLRPNAGEAGERGEQRIESGGAHAE